MQNHHCLKAAILSALLSISTSAVSARQSDDRQCDLLVKKSEQLMEKNKYKAAKVVLRKALSLNKARADVYGNLVRAELDDDLEAAVSDAAKALELAPDSSLSWYAVGIARLRSEKADEALHAFSKAIELDPKNDRAYHNRAHYYLDQRKYDLAISDIAAWMSIKPNAHAYELRGEALSKVGKEQQALADLDKSILMEPSGAAYVKRASLHMSLGSFDKIYKDVHHALAFSDLEQPYASHKNMLLCLAATAAYKSGKLADYNRDLKKAKSLDRKDPFPYLVPALLSLEKKDYPKMFPALDQAIALKPDLEQAHTLRFNALIDLQRFDEALSSARIVLKANPNAAFAKSARNLCLTTLLRNKQFEKALEESAIDLTINPKDDSVLSVRCDALQHLGRREESLSVVEELIKCNPRNAHLHAVRASLCIDLQQYSDAEIASTDAIKLDRNSWDAFYNRAFASYKLGRTEDALADVNVAMLLAPNQAAASKSLGLRGDIYGTIKRWDESQADCEAVVKNNPNNENDLLCLGNVFFRQGKYLQAFSTYNRLLHLNPGSASGHSNLSCVFLNWGNYDRSVASAKRAIDLDPVCPSAHTNLGLAYGKQGKWRESLEALSKAIELKPNNLDALQGRAAAYKALGKNELAEQDILRCRQLSGATQLDLSIRPMDA